MRIISINLNGIRSADRKGFYGWLKTISADFICLQELKAQEKDMLDYMLNPEGYQGFFSYAQKSGYSGVGIYSKQKPLNVVNDIGLSEFLSEGRYIEIQTKKISIISTYFPSGSSGKERQEFKMLCLEKIKPILKEKLIQNENIILCGDLNIAHQEIDLKNYKGNKNNSGFLPEERSWIDDLFKKIGWYDAYRIIYPEVAGDSYTWWSNRGRAWDNNVGWRIDYQIISENLVDKILEANVYKTQRFSDHAPLIIDYDFEL